MNEILAGLILAVVQGITEWLPISSSGHLVLLERLLGYRLDLSFEVALHFGTLMAVFVYFGRDLVDIVRDFISGRWESENGKIAWLLIIASVPAAIAGYFFLDFFESTFESLGIVALGFAITAVFLFIASLNLAERKSRVGVLDAVLIGIGQTLALLPGISRSGATISVGLMRGLSEKAAMRFSFLMAIPIILGASLLTIGNTPLPASTMWAALVSFFVGLATIHILFKCALKSKKNLRWFALYALVMALASLMLAF